MEEYVSLERGIKNDILIYQPAVMTDCLNYLNTGQSCDTDIGNIKFFSKQNAVLWI